MKVVNKVIKTKAIFSIDGKPEPISFMYNDRLVKVDRIVNVRKDKIAGFEYWIFTCQNDRLFEVRYEIKTCRWILFKI